MVEKTLKYTSLAMVWVTGLITFLIALYVICLGMAGCIGGICALCDKLF